jgi:hypothetical protein
LHYSDRISEYKKEEGEEVAMILEEEALTRAIRQ